MRVRGLLPLGTHQDDPGKAYLGAQPTAKALPCQEEALAGGQDPTYGIFVM